MQLPPTASWETHLSRLAANIYNNWPPHVPSSKTPFDKSTSQRCFTAQETHRRAKHDLNPHHQSPGSALQFGMTSIHIKTVNEWAVNTEIACITAYLPPWWAEENLNRGSSVTQCGLVDRLRAEFTRRCEYVCTWSFGWIIIIFSGLRLYKRLQNTAQQGARFTSNCQSANIYCACPPYCMKANTSH